MSPTHSQPPLPQGLRKGGPPPALPFTFTQVEQSTATLKLAEETNHYFLGKIEEKGSCVTMIFW